MKNLVSVLVLSLGISPLGMAQGTGQGEMAKRCTDDSLTKGEAVARVSWAFRCAEKQVRDYYATLGHNRNDPYEDVIFELRSAWLLTARGKPKPRPAYPTFTTSDLKKGWKAPTNNDQSCRVKVPAGFMIQAVCLASCYTPEERILYSSGFVPIQEAFQEKLQDIMIVSETSSLKNVSLEPSKVRLYVDSIRETDHKILVLGMESGGELKVTRNHPLVEGSGFIREAQDLTAGNHLVKQDGSLDRIESIETIDYFGKVYNVEPATDSLKGNLLVAEGYLSGSNWYQNDGYSNLNKRILREKFPEALLVK